MKRFIIAGNWKMHLNLLEMRSFFLNLQNNQCLFHHKDITKIICPVFPLIAEAINLSKGLKILIGAQNVSQYDKGAFTGEVSANILKSIETQYCIIGHSERRQYFKEDEEIIRLKWMQLRSENINPIICIGETLEQRENNETFNVIEKQLNGIFSDMDLKVNEDLLIAYEPVWAIGTGKSATPEMAQEVHKYIRKILNGIYGKNAEDIPLLYGGSVKSKNIRDLLSQKDIDGALIGGASLIADEFAEMTKIAGDLIENA
ncbi:MAG: triose-phosphate isomerase [Candidatus Cloacimonetes bacterium]|jgi:triosephosphate isomerase|nr:triose-phosphate isomerase [Candidatus Cloacimonadota bacterium]MDD4154983.1 triose-phosphate isomerase [Candidatus Cloacimonadota bacterium]